MVLNTRLGRLPDPSADLLGPVRRRLQRHCLMGETFDEEFVLGIIRELSEGIGPRLGGSEASHRAADYLSELLGGMGLDVRMQAFSYLGWEYDRMPQISVTAPVDEETRLPADGLHAGKRRADRGDAVAGRRSAGDPGRLRVHAPCGRRGWRAAGGDLRPAAGRPGVSASEPRPDVHRTGSLHPEGRRRPDPGVARRREGGARPTRDVRPARLGVHRLERDRPPAGRARGAHRRFKPLRHGLEGTRSDGQRLGRRRDGRGGAAHEGAWYAAHVRVHRVRGRGVVPVRLGVLRRRGLLSRRDRSIQGRGQLRSARPREHALGLGWPGLPARDSPTRSSTTWVYETVTRSPSPTPIRDPITIPSGREEFRPVSRSSCRCRPSTISRADTMAIVDPEKIRTIVDVVDGVARALDRQPVS